MKNNKILLIISIVAIVLIGIILINYENTNNTVLMDEEKIISSSSSISMMLETGESTGVYEVSKDTSWPTSGYTFNESLSKCENGSTLAWDSTTGSIIVSGTKSDKCYVYFDVEKQVPVITNATVTYDCGSAYISELTLEKDVNISYYVVVLTDHCGTTIQYTLTSIDDVMTTSSVTLSATIYVIDENGNISDVFETSLVSNGTNTCDVCK